MDRLENLTIFIEVAQQGGFAAAARRLGHSPAAVTRAVAALEARVGIRLLNRTTRAVSLTEAGERFLVGAKRVLADLAEIEDAAAGQGRAPRGELAVTAPLVFGRLHVLPIVNAYLAQHSDVTARLVLTDRPIDLIEEGIDVAVRIGPLADAGAIATSVGVMRRVIVAAPEYLARRGTPDTPKDLTRHDIIAFTGATGSVRWSFGDDAGGVAVRLSPRLTVTTAEAAVDAVTAGLGVVRLISYQAVAALTAGTVVRLLAAHERDNLPVHILYPAGRHPAPKLRAFVDLAAPRLRRSLDEIGRTLALENQRSSHLG